MATSYRTNLTDEQWEIIKTLIPKAKSGGRRRTVDMREVVNGIFYILVAGCAWYLLPHDFPKWKTVYHYFRQWRIDGDWQSIHEQLRQWVRAMVSLSLRCPVITCIASRKCIRSRVRVIA